MESLRAKDTQHESVVTRTSTEAQPYHFVGSGLRNVYLVGVEYRLDEATGEQSADIPCLPNLMEAIGKVLVEKRFPLQAEELRFLRKRLRLASKVFAKMVGLSEEQYSRLENGATVTATVDRVVRLLYAALASLSQSEIVDVAKTTWTAELGEKESIVACRDDHDHWRVQTKAA